MKKLTLKKQVISALSDVEKKKILGGAANSTDPVGPPRFSIDNICTDSERQACDSDMCSLKSSCCPA